MTPQRAAQRMQNIRKKGDNVDREDAIALLCEIARQSGFYRTVEIFEEIPSVEWRKD